jgi:hypothetical protein
MLRELVERNDERRDAKNLRALRASAAGQTNRTILRLVGTSC